MKKSFTVLFCFLFLIGAVFSASPTPDKDVGIFAKKENVVIEKNTVQAVSATAEIQYKATFAVAEQPTAIILKSTETKESPPGITIGCFKGITSNYWRTKTTGKIYLRNCSIRQCIIAPGGEARNEAVHNI